MRPRASAVLVTIGLAAAVHLDWHFARPAHHQLSLGLSWHWLLAIPVFALVGWYVARTWPLHQTRASFGIIGSAILLGGVLEPAWEYFIADAPFEWAFGAARNHALLVFLATGLVAYVATLVLLRSRHNSIAG